MQQKGYIRQHTSVRLPESQPCVPLMTRRYARHGPTSSRVLPRQRSRDLDDMIEVVRDPGREELAQRNRSELRMASRPVEIGVCHAQCCQLTHIVAAQCRELVEQAVERASSRYFELGKAIELVERPALAVVEDDARARHPVGELAVDQVADDVEGAPRLAAFVALTQSSGRPRSKLSSVFGVRSRTAMASAIAKERRVCAVCGMLATAASTMPRFVLGVDVL